MHLAARNRLGALEANRQDFQTPIEENTVSSGFVPTERGKLYVVYNSI